MIIFLQILKPPLIFGFSLLLRLFQPFCGGTQHQFWLALLCSMFSVMFGYIRELWVLGHPNGCAVFKGLIVLIRLFFCTHREIYNPLLAHSFSRYSLRSLAAFSFYRLLQKPIYWNYNLRIDWLLSIGRIAHKKCRGETIKAYLMETYYLFPRIQIQS